MGDVGRATELLAARADPDATDWRGMGAVHLCCQSDRAATLAILTELLAAGVDIEQPTRDRWRYRPLHMAARSPYATTAHTGHAFSTPWRALFTHGSHRPPTLHAIRALFTHTSHRPRTLHTIRALFSLWCVH
jgi:hypothetical protein